MTAVTGTLRALPQRKVKPRDLKGALYLSAQKNRVAKTGQTLSEGKYGEELLGNAATLGVDHEKCKATSLSDRKLANRTSEKLETQQERTPPKTPQHVAKRKREAVSPTPSDPEHQPPTPVRLKSQTAAERFQHLLKASKENTTSPTASQLKEQLHPGRNLNDGVDARTLINESPCRKTLCLPKKYVKILKIFAALEQSCHYMMAQGRSVIFETIRKPVENISGHAFDLPALCQLLTLDDALYDLTPAVIVHQHRRIDSWHITLKNAESSLEDRYFRDRETRLRRKLHDMVDQAHQIFLNAGKLRAYPCGTSCWHADFDVDSAPDLKEAQTVLPLKLDAVPSRISPTSKVIAEVERVLAAESVEKMVAKSIEEIHKGPTSASSEFTQEKNAVAAQLQPSSILTSPKKDSTPTKRPKVDSLLLRIRERNTKLQKYNAVLEEGKCRQKAQLSRCLILCDIIKELYNSNQKTSMAMGDVAIRLSQSSAAMLSQDEAMEHLRILCQYGNVWLYQDEMHGKCFLRLRESGTREDAKAALLRALQVASAADG